MTPFRSGMRALVALLVLASGCRYLRPIDPDAEPQAEPPEAVQPAEAAAVPAAEPAGTVTAPLPERIGRLGDANIAAMLLAWNNTGISYARLVPSRALRDDVKQFAERMVTDHMGVNALLTETLEKLEMAPQENLASVDMRDESATNRSALRDLSGFAFDSAYITNEVSHHRRFLASIDNVMLPAARNGELQNLLATMRPAVAAHLAHAEQVWADVMAKR